MFTDLTALRSHEVTRQVSRACQHNLFARRAIGEQLVTDRRQSPNRNPQNHETHKIEWLQSA
jgi:hypothetical protein